MGSYSSSKLTEAQSMRTTSADADARHVGSTDVTGGSEAQFFLVCGINPEKSNPYTSSQNVTALSYRVWSDRSATCTVATLGSTSPPGFMNLSRASTTEGSMDSNSSAYPIHSDTTTSTGSVISSYPMSSMRPRITSMTSSKPLALMRRRVCRVMPLASTAYTLRAPARAANMDRMPVPHPTSSTTLPLRSAACASMAARYAPVRASSPIISRWMPRCA
mmetsp:Transcript_20063/g.49973  ORF Transcript_20063/g.49973 Transcript_20063/m.49973 type:complete len:219 (-) Transcript_20063:747-1403(-)